MQHLSDILHPNALILHVDDNYLITWNRSATVNVWSFNPKNWIWTNIDAFSVEPEDEEAARRNAFLWIEKTTGFVVPLGLGQTFYTNYTSVVGVFRPHGEMAKAYQMEDNVKVYGPYTRSDGRQHVILVSGSLRRTVSYPKYLMEKHLGRELDPNLETIDHIDRDFTNNSLENLRVIPRSKHSCEDQKRVKLLTGNCLMCSKVVENIKPSKARRDKKAGKAGPFCSKQCIGKYGSYLQNKKVEKFNNDLDTTSEYFYLDKI